MLSLLPESWLQFISGLSLPQNQSQWTLEWIRTKILEEDFRRYTLRGGDDSTSGYAMQGTWRDRGLKVAGVGRAAFRAPDGGLVVLKDVLLVPGLKANLISLRKLGQAGVSTTTNGSKTFKGLRGDP
ncbi:hypothetical protein CLOP_g10851 [Closterium sp. NIES-67]|nr:hypothetical protein CLOP_g10851 [Closterium sp. NIES-67]